MKEEKAQFMAQYWDQKVIRDGTYLHEVNSYFNLMHESFCLELKPLSSITDEDTIEVARLYWNNAKTGEVSHTKNVMDTLIQKTNVADYVRSKGYALPFRNYSVDQLIEMGWLKLTTK